MIYRTRSSNSFGVEYIVWPMRDSGLDQGPHDDGTITLPKDAVARPLDRPLAVLCSPVLQATDILPSHSPDGRALRM